MKDHLLSSRLKVIPKGGATTIIFLACNTYGRQASEGRYTYLQPLLAQPLLIVSVRGILCYSCAHLLPSLGMSVPGVLGQLDRGQTMTYRVAPNDLPFSRVLNVCPRDGAGRLRQLVVFECYESYGRTVAHFPSYHLTVKINVC